jgi:hypothetical protein
MYRVGSFLWQLIYRAGLYPSGTVDTTSKLINDPTKS